jgi:NADPH:quinone reductase-like Zn-dependent oxidoreductase
VRWALHVRVCAPQVTQLRPGDLVVPLAASLGTWRERGVFDAAGWHKVPSDLPLPAAATITIKCVPLAGCGCCRRVAHCGLGSNERAAEAPAAPAHLPAR